MTHSTDKDSSVALKKMTRLGERLAKMQSTGMIEKIPVHKKAALVKRYKRSLNQLSSCRSSITKAAVAAGIALLFFLESNGQMVKYKRAEIANPLKQTALPYGIIKPVFVDIDNDGDLDCYALHDAGNYTQFSFLRNNGTIETPVFVLEGTGGFPEPPAIDSDISNEGPAFADIDGDGDYDCFIGEYDFEVGITKYFKNIGTKESPSFQLQPNGQNPLGFTGGVYGLYFSLVDIDKDGDYDLFNSAFYYDRFYRNEGGATMPNFVQERFTEHDGAINRKYAHTIYIDWDKDGLTDMIKTNVSGIFKQNAYYKNTGTLIKHKFSKDFQNGPNLPKDFNLYALVDLNNDGLPEAFSYDGSYAVGEAPIANVENTNSYAKTNAEEIKVDMHLYPNPFINECILQWNSNTKTKLLIKISDASGKLVETITTDSKEIHMGKALKPGIYFLQAIKGSQVIYTQKLVKQ